MFEMKSSYKINSYEKVFKSLCEEFNPKSLLEIGILDGYSLNSFASKLDSSVEIVAIDLFDEYEFNNSNRETILKQFKKYKNVKIEKGDFYNFYKNSKNFDMIHIDISNDADIYEFAVKNYLPRTNLVMLLEGGSEERDSVDWMIKYKKKKINPYLKKISRHYNIRILENFPSLTIINLSKDN